MNSKVKGNIGEAVVLAEALKRGITVLQPFGDNERYDLVFEINGKFKRVQVKAATPKRDVIKVHCRSNQYDKEKKSLNQMNLYSSNEIDLLLLVNLETFDIYNIPMSAIDESSSGSFNLRLTETKNKQKKRVRLAKDYLW